MQTAKNGDTVATEFAVRTDDGRVFDDCCEIGPQENLAGLTGTIPAN